MAQQQDSTHKMAHQHSSELSSMLEQIVQSVKDLEKANDDMMTDGHQMIRTEVQGLTVQEESLNVISSFVCEKVSALKDEIADCKELVDTLAHISAQYRQKVQDTLMATERLKQRKLQVCVTKTLNNVFGLLLLE